MINEVVDVFSTTKNKGPEQNHDVELS